MFLNIFWHRTNWNVKLSEVGCLFTTCYKWPWLQKPVRKTAVPILWAVHLPHSIPKVPRCFPPLAPLVGPLVWKWLLSLLDDVDYNNPQKKKQHFMMAASSKAPAPHPTSSWFQCALCFWTVWNTKCRVTHSKYIEICYPIVGSAVP